MTQEENIAQFNQALPSFISSMKGKLKKNAGKGNWRTNNVQGLVALMKQEVFELDDALGTNGVTPEEIIDECADIANFCFFIADLVNVNSKKFQQYQTYVELKAIADRGEFKQFMEPEFVDEQDGIETQGTGMPNEQFEELIGAVKEGGQIMRGEVEPSRIFQIEKHVRPATHTGSQNYGY